MTSHQCLSLLTQKKKYVIIEPGDRYLKTWIGQPSSDLDKRYRTLQILTRGDGLQANIAIVFRDRGKRISPDEKAAYHPDVDVYWETNAWADTECSVNWVNSILKETAKDIEKFLLFVDNLTAQQTT